MRHPKPSVRWATCAWLCALPLLLTSLLIPATRELHWLTFRLLARLPTQNTRIEGQPASCVIRIVPEVDLKHELYARCRREAAQSPDSFIIASRFGFLPDTFPPGAAWRDHPMLEWAAIEGAHRGAYTWDRHRGIAASRTSDTRTADQRTTDRAILDTIRFAQESHSDNGLLWLAEALAHFGQGDPAAAIEAAKLAAKKPSWHTPRLAAFQHTRGLYEAYGLPRFDASLRAEWTLSNCADWSILARVCEHIGGRMSESVAREDDTEFGHLLSLQTSLRATARTESGAICNPAQPSGSYEALVTAMARRLGRPLAREDEGNRERWYREARRVFEAYAGVHGGPALLAGYRAEEDKQSEQREEHYRKQDSSLDAWLKTALYGGIAGSFCLELMSLLGALLLLEAFYVLVAPRLTAGEGRFSRWRWPAGLAVLGAMIAVTFVGCDTVNQPVGLHGGDAHSHALTPSQMNLLLASCVCVVAFGLRWLARIPSRAVYYRLTVLAVLIGYLFLNGLGAYYRHATLERLAGFT